MPHLTPPPELKASTASSRRSFWRNALLGLPAINVVILGLAGFATGLASPTPFLVAAAVLAPVELVALIAQSRSSHVSVPSLLAAMVGTALMTALGFFLVLVLYFVVAFAVGCQGGCKL